MARSRLLIVDDDPRLRKLLGQFLSDAGYDTRVVGSVAAARAALAERPPHAVVTDLKLPDGTGLEVLDAARRLAPGTPVVVATAFGTVETAVDAMKRGAFHVLVKPFLMAELRGLVERALEMSRQPRAAEGGVPLPRLAGDSPAMRRLRDLVARGAPTDATVLITGESGTGKEIVARLVHAGGPRAAGPFVQVNCAALPPDLLEAELYGYVKGAFTGAAQDRPGRFRTAHGGTLFLDEIATLPYPVQAKLLRALQDGEVTPLGADVAVATDARIVAATNQDLAALVRERQFREDLYYRLNVFPITVPPLRERLEDLPELVAELLGSIARRLKRPVPAIGDADLGMLRRHTWPGNVRELENTLERAAILSCGDVLDLAPAMNRAAAGGPLMPDGRDVPLALAVSDLERKMLLAALERSRGRKKQAAEILGISPRALSYYLGKHGVHG